jgi:hypothetical protein
VDCTSPGSLLMRTLRSEHEVLDPTWLPLGIEPESRQPGSYAEPEVPFEDIATDLREPSFWIVSGLPTILTLSNTSTRDSFTSKHD